MIPTGKAGYEKVTDTIVHYDKRVRRLEFTDGSGHTATLQATHDHPFWVRNAGWVHAGKLTVGDEVFTSRGGWLRVGATWVAGRTRCITWWSRTSTPTLLAVWGRGCIMRRAAGSSKRCALKGAGHRRRTD